MPRGGGQGAFEGSWHCCWVKGESEHEVIEFFESVVGCIRVRVEIIHVKRGKKVFEA